MERFEQNQQSAVNLALLYGAQGSMSGLSGTEDEKILATQMIIWEIVSGCRNATAPYGNLVTMKYTLYRLSINSQRTQEVL